MYSSYQIWRIIKTNEINFLTNCLLFIVVMTFTKQFKENFINYYEWIILDSERSDDFLLKAKML